MTGAWLFPLLVASGVGLAATPVARHLALSSGLVDRPAPHKSHRRTTPYLGGIALGVAVIAGLLSGRPDGVEVVIASAGALLVAMGLLDDDRTLRPGVRLLVELALGGFVLLLGVHLRGTGVAVLNEILTLLLIVGITNSVNLLDNLDGLASGVTAMGAAGLVVLGVLGGYSHAVSLGAALVGACLAFLIFNAPPASIFMGDAGSLFLGFLLVIMTLDTSSHLAAPVSLEVPLLVLALPIVDTAVVVFARVRNGHSPFKGGRDHISHRLARLGLRSAGAVTILILLEAVMSGLAVAAARGVVPPPAGLLVGLVLMAGLVTVAGRVQVYHSEGAHLPRRLKVVLWGGLLVLALLPAPAVLAAWRSHLPAEAGQVAAENGLTAAESGDLSAASSDFLQAKIDFTKAASDLNNPLASVGLVYPVLSSNLHDARLEVGVGERLSAVGAEVARSSNRLRYEIRAGNVPVASIASDLPALEHAHKTIALAMSALAGYEPQYALAQISHAKVALLHVLVPASHRIEEALGLARHLPGLFGLSGEQHYFLALQDNSEQRATGGLIGLYGVLIARDGHLHLESLSPIGRLNRNAPLSALGAPTGYLDRYGRFDPSGNWQNINMSPDFPTVGRVITHLFPRSGGSKINGVIAVDPLGLSGLLKLTGPITVSGWPVPISPSNVAQILLNQSYVAYANNDPARQRFLENLTRQVFSRLSQLSIGDPATMLADLEPVVRQHHLAVYSGNKSDEAWLATLGLTDSIPPVRSDMLELTTQNAAGNKIDYYLHRSLTYQVTLDPLGTAAVPTQTRIVARVTVRLFNAAPNKGLPPSIIGPYEPGYFPGENRTFLTLYTPLSFSSVSINGANSGMQMTEELGRFADSAFITIPSRRTATCRLVLGGTVRLRQGGWYELTLGSQPLVRPDKVSISISISPGWEIGGVRGARLLSSSSASARLQLDSTRYVWVELRRPSSVLSRR